MQNTRTHQTEMMQIKLSTRMKNFALQMVVTISENHRQESKVELPNKNRL
jgi:hypothetical protein